MALTNDLLKSLIDEHTSPIQEELDRLRRISDYVNGNHEKPYTPRNATDQYKKLVDRSVTNLLPMVRNAPLHQLHVTGIWTGQKTGDPVPAWEIWQKNRFDLISTQIISSALTDNYAYGITLPGATKRTGKDIPYMQGKAARRMYALYDDPVSDLWPKYAFDLDTNGEIVGIWDERFRYDVIQDPARENSDGSITYPPPYLANPQEHGSDHVPVVRYVPTMDLEGNCYGEIEPNIPIQDRINQVSFDLLRVQHYGAFQRSGFSGVKVAKDKNGNPIPIDMDPARITVLEDHEARPWQLSGDPLDGYILAFETAVHHLAVASQTPAHYLLGKLANLSADAIAAAETTLTRKVFAYKQTFGEPFEQQVRLASKLAGVEFPENAEIQWADRESRSLSQVADAVNKLVAVGVPQEALWEMIPGVTQTQLDNWHELAKEQRADVLDGLANTLNPGGQDAE